MLKKLIAFLALFTTTFTPSFTLAKNIPHVTVIATGGTIAGAGASATDAKYTPGQILIENILKSLPNLSGTAEINGEQFSNIASQDITNEFLISLARRVDTLLRRSDIDGVVIMHGTDTMEETAYFLNLVVKSRKPIVLVGSMRPSTSTSADGPMNLFNAISLAASKEAVGKGAMLVFNDNIYAARDVSKSYTTNVIGFTSGEFGSLGYIYYGKPNFYYNTTKSHTYNSEFNIAKITTLPKVEILYGYSGQSSIVIDNLLKSDIDGIVSAGVGDGNFNKTILETIIRNKPQNMVLVRSSRVKNGPVMADMEIEDTKLGFVVSDNLTPQKSRILLSLALTKTRDPKEIQKIFYKY